MKIPFSVYDFFGYLATGYLVLAVIDYTFFNQRLLFTEISATAIPFWIIVTYVAGHIVSHLAGLLLEKVVLHRIFGPPQVHMLRARPARGLLPHLFPGNFALLPPETQRRIGERAQELGVAPSAPGFFLHSYSTVRRDPPTVSRLNTFISLYGFCRNMSMAALLAVPILFAGYVGALPDEGSAISRSSPAELLWLAGVAAFVAVALFYRYLKFYRHYTLARKVHDSSGSRDRRGVLAR